MQDDFSTPTSVHSDSSWLRRLQAARDGDVRILGELLDEYWQPLWEQADKSIDGSVAPKLAPSDLVQETFVEAQRSLKNFNGQTPREFYGWLRTILANNVRDAWRHYVGTEKRNTTLEQSLNLDGVEQSLEAIKQTPVDSVLRRERNSHIDAILSGMPEHYSTVIRLRYWESMTFEQIGQSMNRSPDAVRQLWYRAIEYFTAEIEKHE